MSLPVKLGIILLLVVGAVYSLGPTLRGLSDGPELTPKEFEDVLATQPATALELVTALDEFRVTSQVAPYGSGKNELGIRKTIEQHTNQWLDSLSYDDIQEINWLGEELPTRIEKIMEFRLQAFEDKRGKGIQLYFVYLDADTNIVGWRKHKD